MMDSERNEFAPFLGANSFLLELTSYLKGFGVQKIKQDITKVVSLVKKNRGKFTQCIQGYLSCLLYLS